MPLGPGSRLDAYELLQPLGAGGMGEVWLATEVRLGRKVALKLLPAELTRDPARVQRFEQEARAASALNHPNVCTILALGETSEGQHYIAMEYVEGETLRRRIAAGRLTIRESLEIAIQILGGQLKTGNLWTGQNRQFPVRPRPVSSTSFHPPCANRSAPWSASSVVRI